LQADDPETDDLQTQNADDEQTATAGPAAGPWGSEQDAPTPASSGRPPPVPSSGPISGPWGPHRD
jgi:hypothetical protein